MTLQPAPVMPPDAELWAAGYIQAFLATRAEVYAQGVFVGKTRPADNRPRMVTVRRDGGPVVGVFDYPRLAFRVWATVDKEASDLARLVVGGLKVSPGWGAAVAVTNIYGPSPIPDSSQPQYLVNAELQMRCSAL